MPVIEITLKETKGGAVIKMRERIGQNMRGRWVIAKFPRGSLRGRMFFQAIKYISRELILDAKSGEDVPMTINTGPIKG